MALRGGIDLGGTKILSVVVDDDHTILGRDRRLTPASKGPAAVAEHMAASLLAAAQSAGIRPDLLSGVGVGSPGVVDAPAGTVANADNFVGWREPFPIAERLGGALGAPVYLSNDVDVAVEGEARLGAGRDLASFLGIWWGTGVGGGLILQRERWTGRGSAGEFGHMVVRRNGARCPCGRRGCIEAYAGRGAMEARARKLVKKGEDTDLFKIMKKRDVDRLSSGVWSRALGKGDPLAVKLIDRAVAALGAGAASVMNLLDLEGIVIGGGLGTRLGDPYAGRIAAAMKPHLFNTARHPIVRVSELGDDAGAVGATLIAEPRSDATNRIAVAR
ncbi:MAG: ROK family protein [Gaiellales bacterium]